MKIMMAYVEKGDHEFKLILNCNCTFTNYVEGLTLHRFFFLSLRLKTITQIRICTGCEGSMRE